MAWLVSARCISSSARLARAAARGGGRVPRSVQSLGSELTHCHLVTVRNGQSRPQSQLRLEGGGLGHPRKEGAAESHRKGPGRRGLRSRAIGFCSQAPTEAVTQFKKELEASNSGRRWKQIGSTFQRRS